MGWCWETASILLIGSPTDEKHAPPHLRDTVLSRQKLGTFHRIAGISECLADFLEDGTFAECCKTGNVLDDHAPGLQFGSEAQELSEETIPCVSKFPADR